MSHTIHPKERLTFAGNDLAQWSLKEGAEAAAVSNTKFGPFLDAVEKGSLQAKDITSVSDLQNMLEQYVGGDVDVEMVSTLSKEIKLARNARIATEINTRMFQGRHLPVGVSMQYAKGENFDLPLVQVDAADAFVHASSFPLDGLHETHSRFVDDKGNIKLAVHPDELKHRDFAVSDAVSNVRTSSSERTLYAYIAGVEDPVMIKTDLANVVHAEVTRPLAINAGRAAVDMTDFMLKWIHRKQPEHFGILPEPLTVGSKENDMCAIVRMTQPFPKHNSGSTWTAPVYTLHAKDEADPNGPETVVKLIKARPDKSVSEVDYFIDSILTPLVESNLTLVLDIGSSGQPHGQNTHIEFDSAGLPTGRIIHADVEAFWPAPELAKPLGREEFYQQYGYEYHENKFSRLNTTFFTYFVQGVLDPLFEVMARYYPDNKSELKEKSHMALKKGLIKRKDQLELIETFSKHARDGASRVDDFMNVMNDSNLPWNLQKAYQHFEGRGRYSW